MIFQSVVLKSLVTLQTVALSAQPTTLECRGYVTAFTVTGTGTSRGLLTDKPITFANQWIGKERLRYHHVINGGAGPVRITLEACSSGGAGTEVSVYPASALGVRQPAEKRVLVATTSLGRQQKRAALSIPPSQRGASIGTLHLVVIVDGAREPVQMGSYRLTVSR